MLSKEDIEHFRATAPKPKPKPQLMVEPASAQTIANAKARPDKVKIVTESDDGVAVIDRPRRSGVVEVLEVDGNGRPKLVRCWDATTRELTTMRFEDGYPPRAGAVSAYNPIDALKGHDQ